MIPSLRRSYGKHLEMDLTIASQFGTRIYLPTVLDEERGIPQESQLTHY